MSTIDYKNLFLSNDQFLTDNTTNFLTKINDIVSIINNHSKIENNWIQPATADKGISCIVSVRQLPGGEVISVIVERCNGDETVRRSVEAAVYKASPLPDPEDPALFERNLRFIFEPYQ